jgi:2-hydroxychromene-2-carboxylate isomerase
MPVTVEIFYDLSSPWTRIAFANLQREAPTLDATLVWRPFLVGGVFNAVNQTVYAARANPDDRKFRLSWVWLKEWAELAGVAMNFPSVHHPAKSVHAMRFCCALAGDQAQLLAFTHAAFEAYFTDQRNIDDPAMLATIADECGLDGAALAEAAGSQPVKDLLRTNTQEAIDRGAFGSPSIFVGGRYMYFGNDQLPLVRQRIALLSEGG